MKNYFILLISLLFLAGCSGEASQATGSEDKAEKPAAKSAAAELKPVSLKYEGLGGLSGETDVAQAAVEAVFPGLTVRDVPNSKGVIAMTQGFKKDNGQFVEVLRVLPNPETGKIAMIEIHDTDLLEGFNAKIGQTHADISNSGVKLTCAPGTGDAYKGKILCRSAQTGTISYVFSVADWGKGSKKKLPKEDVVAGATLGRVLWTAPE